MPLQISMHDASWESVSNEMHLTGIITLANVTGYKLKFDSFGVIFYNTDENLDREISLSDILLHPGSSANFPFKLVYPLLEEGYSPGENVNFRVYGAQATDSQGVQLLNNDEEFANLVNVEYIGWYGSEEETEPEIEPWEPPKQYGLTAFIVIFIAVFILLGAGFFIPFSSPYDNAVTLVKRTLSNPSSMFPWPYYWGSEVKWEGQIPEQTVDDLTVNYGYVVMLRFAAADKLKNYDYHGCAIVAYKVNSNNKHGAMISHQNPGANVELCYKPGDNRSFDNKTVNFIVDVLKEGNLGVVSP